MCRKKKHLDFISFSCIFIYNEKDELDEALVYYHKALKIRCRVYKNNENHPDIQNTKRSIHFCTNHKSRLDGQQYF